MMASTENEVRRGIRPAQDQGLGLVALQSPFALSDREIFAPGWSNVVHSAVPQRQAQKLGNTLLPFFLYPDGSAATAAELEAHYAFDPAPHRVYALLWLAMAALLVLFYLRHGLRRGRVT